MFRLGQVCFAFLFGITALAAETPIATKIKTVGAKGTIQEVQWKSNSRWIWVNDLPVIESTVELPAEWKTKGVSASGAKAELSGNHAVVVQAAQSVVKITLEVETEKKKSDEVGLVLEFVVPQTFLANSSKCDLSLLQMRPEAPQPSPIYVGALCEIKDGKLIATLVGPSDSELTSLETQNETHARTKGKKNEIVFEIPENDVTAYEAKQLAKVQAKDVVQNNISTFWVERASVESHKKKLRFQLGLGGGMLAYREDPISARSTQWSLFLEAQGNYRPYSFLEATLRVQSHLQSLSISPAGTTAARTYGILGDFAYILPWQPIKGGQIRVGAGWTYLGMLVSDNSYGVKYLTGPQFLLDTRFPIFTSHTFAIEFRYIGLAGQTLLQNYDWTVRLQYGISPYWSPKQWLAFLQTGLRHVSGESNSNSNQVYLTSLVAGILYEFP